MITCYTQNEEKIMFLLEMTRNFMTTTEISYITGLSVEVVDATLFGLFEQDHVMLRDYRENRWLRYIEIS